MDLCLHHHKGSNESDDEHEALKNMQFLTHSEEFWDSAEMTRLLGLLDMGRWMTHVTKLASWNRFSGSPEIVEAKNYLVGALTEIPGIQVKTEKVQVLKYPNENVLGFLPATKTDQIVLEEKFKELKLRENENENNPKKIDPHSLIIIGAHYDSISQDPMTTAPGAVDNASGTAGVLELARVFSGMKERKRDILFIFFPGEEQGYFGSKAHVDEHKNDVYFMLNMDMIGWNNPKGSNMLIETLPIYTPLALLFTESAIKFSSLKSVISYHAWGSDHMPFLKNKIPALLTTNEDCETYSEYHKITDVTANVSQDVAKEILRMNIGALVQIINNFVDLTKYHNVEKKYIQVVDMEVFSAEPPEDSM